MRTDGEIVAMIVGLNNDRAGIVDFFGFIRSDLINYLPEELAAQFVDRTKPDRKAWQQLSKEPAAVLAQLKDYMSFAWEKANHCRGLSAARSMDHMTAWLWMLDEEPAASRVQHYSHYGKPHLRAICEHYGIDWRALDNGL